MAKSAKGSSESTLLVFLFNSALLSAFSKIYQDHLISHLAYERWNKSECVYICKGAEKSTSRERGKIVPLRHRNRCCPVINSRFRIALKSANSFSSLKKGESGMSLVFDI